MVKHLERLGKRWALWHFLHWDCYVGMSQVKGLEVVGGKLAAFHWHFMLKCQER
jgi:hypothetical protein